MSKSHNTHGAPAELGFAPFALTAPARRDFLLAASAIGLSLLFFVGLVPFAKTPLHPAPAFIGVYQSALVINDLITAAYLFGQYRASSLRPLFLLACGYFFTALIATVHLLTFPGLFAETGLLGAGMQTTAWLYMVWHAGFPLFVIAYACSRPTPLSGRTAAAYLVGVVAVLLAVTLIATVGRTVLPEIMRGHRYAPAYAGVVGATWLCSAIAFAVVWRKRPRTILDLWLLVVMCAWLCDIALAAVFNAGRFDLGFYAGRVYGLLAASFVLCILLVETTILQSRAARMAAEAATAAEQKRTAAALHAKSEALEESQRRLDAVLNNATVAIFLMDEHQHCVYMNAAAEQLTGYTLADTRGRPLHDVVHHTRPDGTPYPLAECPIDRAFPQNNHEHGEEIFVHKDGSFYPVAFTASPIRDTEAKIVGTIIEVRDIREEKRVREELQASEARLREADRKKDEFLATLAHELRNPLAPIRNGLEVLKLAKDNPAVQAQMLATMERQLTHMVRLVDDLLDVSRISRGRIDLRKEPVDLNDVVQHAVETSRSTLKANAHELSVSIAPEPVVVNGDVTRLEQVILNLLNNAAKYTPRGGRISVAVERMGQEAVVRVSDTGIGIPASKLSDIFDLFSQGDTPTQGPPTGLGIGLTLAKRLVELHGGSIAASSDGSGHGSTFTVRLPTLEDAPLIRPVRLNLSPASHSKRILVVDDNVDAASTLRNLLQLAGHEVKVAYDGLEACEKAAVYRPDVVLLDIGMPKLDGFGACRALRAEPWGKDIVIVALTGWGQDEDRRRTKEAGFDAHLVKPAHYGALEKVLNGADA